MIHTVTLTYTTDDDGVHLVCTCGWDVNLGMDAAPGDAWSKAFRHTMAAALNVAAKSMEADDGK